MNWKLTQVKNKYPFKLWTTIIIIEFISLLFLNVRELGLTDLTLAEKVNVFLTINLIIFALMEGYSTWKQTKQAEIRIKIEDSRNELENVYGPLYSIITGKFLIDKQYYLNEDEKERIDDIFITYPHIISKELYQFWRDFIEKMEKTRIFMGERIVIYYLSNEPFEDRITKEYKEKIDNYKKLVK